MTTREFETESDAQTEALGARLAPGVRPGSWIYVRGPLGAGKTTFVRGLLRGLGHEGSVTSPTFTFIEPYVIGNIRVFHFDFYRVEDPAELEFLGLRDYFDRGSVCLVEWPERASAVLPTPDLDVMIRFTNDRGRVLRLQTHSEIGAAALSALG
jgi:tRNA threonylcarbamoyladenosine biosynthesis protein TsaE